jgi:glutamate--cysteine ligase
MFLLKRHGEVVKNTGQTFRAFLRDGFSGHRATHEDWTTHLNTLFPEVRLKRTLEIRGADSQPTEMVAALSALYKGLLYDERALAAAEALTSPIAFADAERARAEIADRALGATLGGRPLSRWAGEVLAIAEGGLERIADRDAQGQDERVHLTELRRLVERGESPADDLLRRVEGAPDFVSAVVREAALR